MSQWKNRIDEPGWYWCWHEYDWGYEETDGGIGRLPKLNYLYRIETNKYGDRIVENVVGKREFGPSGMVSKYQGFTFLTPVEETNWFWGPIRAPKPPLPTEAYIDDLRKRANETDFEPDPILKKFLMSKDFAAYPEKAKKARDEAKKQLDIVLKRIAEYDKE
jgi:hypothetical protein